MQHACRLAKGWPLTASRHAARAFASFNKTSFREPDPNKPKLVLAYSGGLDTSTQLAWLVNEKGFEVCAYIADLGQDDTLEEKDREEICAYIADLGQDDTLEEKD